jgi:uncharacterized protein YxjI
MPEYFTDLDNTLFRQGNHFDDYDIEDNQIEEIYDLDGNTYQIGYTINKNDDRAIECALSEISNKYNISVSQLVTE